MAISDSFKEHLLIERRSILSKMAGYAELQKRLDAIDLLLNEPASGAMAKMKGYEKHWTWAEKVMFVLTEIGEGYAKEVAEKLKELEPEITIDYAETKAAYSLSLLYKRGDITVTAKSGKKYKYGVKKESGNVAE